MFLAPPPIQHGSITITQSCQRRVCRDVLTETGPAAGMRSFRITAWDPRHRHYALAMSAEESRLTGSAWTVYAGGGWAGNMYATYVAAQGDGTYGPPAGERYTLTITTYADRGTVPLIVRRL